MLRLNFFGHLLDYWDCGFIHEDEHGYELIPYTAVRNKMPKEKMFLVDEWVDKYGWLEDSELSNTDNKRYKISSIIGICTGIEGNVLSFENIQFLLDIVKGRMYVAFIDHSTIASNKHQDIIVQTNKSLSNGMPLFDELHNKSKYAKHRFMFDRPNKLKVFGYDTNKRQY